MRGDGEEREAEKLREEEERASAEGTVLKELEQGTWKTVMLVTAFQGL